MSTSITPRANGPDRSGDAVEMITWFARGMLVEFGKRVLWVPVVVGVMLFCAGLALALNSIFSLADYHFIGWAISQIGAWLAAYGFFGGRIRRRLRIER